MPPSLPYAHSRGTVPAFPPPSFHAPGLWSFQHTTFTSRRSHGIKYIYNFKAPKPTDSDMMGGSKSSILGQVQSTTASNERVKISMCSLLEPRIPKVKNSEGKKNQSSDANSVPYAQSYLYPIHSPWADSSSPFNIVFLLHFPHPMISYSHFPSCVLKDSRS